jgi:long-chain acyl-CoA synthetase
MTPPFPSLHAALLHAATPRLDKLALIHEGGEVTYRQFLANVDTVARHLCKLGIGPGDRFAVYGQNTPEHYYCFYAASRLGAVIVPLNPHLTAPEVEYSFRHSEAKILFHDAHVQDAARATIAAERMQPIAALCAPAPEIALSEVAVDPADDFAISYSSGTTGNPKAIVLDQAGLIRVAQSGTQMWGITEADIGTVGLPLGYMYGLNTSSSPVLHAGGTIVLMRRFHPREALELFVTNKATIFMGVPTMFTMMMDYCEQKGLTFTLPDMRMLVTAGAPLPPETAARFVARFGKPLSNYYGLSEAFPIFAQHAGETLTTPQGATGRLAPGAVVEIRRPDGTPCADDEPGEAFVRGPATMKRYNKDPELTAAAMQDGLFRTGDIVQRDAQGFYTITGRIKDVIIRGGHNISPAELEQTLVSHSSVAEAAVVDAPDPVFGEKPVAFVVCRPGASVTAEELMTHAEAILSEFKVPRTIHFLTEMPLGKTGKVDKRHLQKIATQA